MSIVNIGQARVGWGGALGSAMRLRVTVTPNTAGPLSDMTTVSSATLRVEHQDRTVSTWALSISGTPTTGPITFVHVYGPTDLLRAETLRCFVLMVTPGGVIVPSEPFTIIVAG